MTLKDNFNIILKSGIPLTIINTAEITRATQELIKLLSAWNTALSSTNAEDTLKKEGYKLGIWDINNGWNYNGIILKDTKEYNKVFKELAKEQIKAGVYILQNFNIIWDDSSASKKATITQDLIDLTKADMSYKHLFFVGAVVNLPVEISNLFTWVDFALPDKAELLKTAANYKEFVVNLKGKQIEKIADACLGMSMYEAENAIRSAIVVKKGKDVDIEFLYERKSEAVRKSGLLEYIKVEEDITAVGGNASLKDWFIKISKIFKEKEQAEAYKLPFPKGCIIAGISGTGKTLCAKVIANLFGLPLFRSDIGRVFGGLVGETEKNARELFTLYDAVSPAVILLDEVEKAMAGTETGASDAGVAKRFMGNFLYYLQEKKSPSFFVATANDVRSLSPEFMRRFNSLWFIDLPDINEREEIFKIHLTKIKREVKKFHLKELAKQTEGFTGAEIEGTIIEAMYAAFYEDKEITTKDILTAIRDKPLMIKTKYEEITALRNWAKGRARIANLRQYSSEDAWYSEAEKRSSLIVDKEEPKDDKKSCKIK